MIIIPMVGKSSRFFNAGYTIPKYMLPIKEATVFTWAVRSFQHYFAEEEFLFIIRNDAETFDFVQAEIKKLGIKNYSIKVIEHDTRGQAETVYLGVRDEDNSKSLLIFNIDTFRPGFVKPDWIEFCDGYLEVFRGEGDHWSFIEPGTDNQVKKTTEKDRISEYCSTGLYFFKSKHLFDRAFESMRNLELTVKGEYYIAPLYNCLIEEGYKIKYSLIQEEEVEFCGTPQEYVSCQKRRTFKEYDDEQSCIV